MCERHVEFQRKPTRDVFTSWRRITLALNVGHVRYSAATVLGRVGNRVDNLTLSA